MTDRYAHLTDRQREAIATTDRSVAVSAAAGSGKTTVLAERCASIVCDGPSGQCCGVDELLVVTFTEAASSEMRNRIRRAIQSRLREKPDDHYLREQLYLIDGAAISTIHAFCGQLIRRWFPQAGIDPQAAILAGDEARALQREALEECFADLYEADSDLGRAFRRLVEVYGAGNDRDIVQNVLQAQHYLSSLADPKSWLERCRRVAGTADEGSVIQHVDALQSARVRGELAMQSGHHEMMAATIRARWPIAEMHAEALDEHAERLRGWLRKLGGDRDWEAVCSEIADFDFGRAKSRPRDLTDAEKEDFDAAKKVRDDAKRLFQQRLQAGMCAFSRDEYIEGMRYIAPFVNTMAEIVQLTEIHYQEAKARQAVLDFNDLQRKALELLCVDGDVTRPSTIARELQETYRHVLVDEFQDVDPLQAAILRLVSRESTEDEPGNLFTVGDIKQSIYRFRLAEPKLFMERTRNFDLNPDHGRLIHLRENFRSRRPVIEAINAVFQPLMSDEFGGCAYTEDHQLFAGLSYPESREPTFDQPAMEVHLLEAVTESTRPDVDDESGNESESDAMDSEELEGIDREAHLIGSRIRNWMGGDGHPRRKVAQRSGSGELEYRPISYGDIVILLRALPHKAQPIADVLRRMQIPVIVGREEGGFDSTECQDVIALLRLIDNQQQDIPLTAVMRSPILGEPFNEGDLVNIRLHDRTISFHAAVRNYADTGDEQDLRDRVNVFLGRIAHYRERSRHMPVSDLVWSICEDAHYRSYVAGLPDGLKRRDNLFRLHDLACRADAFIEPTLHRFLKYLDDLIEQGGMPSPPAMPGGHEDVVRIMTVHTSKGLEFPVVILADAGKPFNLSDARGMVLIDRSWGIAMRAVDPERRVAYPTLLHQLASENARREDLSEELRLLYVALTRAREHLMVVGRLSSGKFRACQSPMSTGRDLRVDALQLETAPNVLEWLMAALRVAPQGHVDHVTEESADSSAHVALFTYERASTDAWQLPERIQPERSEQLRRFATGAPLLGDEPVPAEDESVRRVLSAIDHVYPYTELTTLPARVAVTELERWDPHDDTQITELPAPRHRPDPVALPAFLSAAGEGEALTRGTITHRLLQLIDLEAPCDEEGLRLQLKQLVDRGRFSAESGDILNIKALAWFFASDLGRRLRAQPAQVHREVSFAARVAPERYDPEVISADPRDAILLRGMVDVVLVDGQTLDIIDYKTDRIDAGQAAERAAAYRGQIQAYAGAMEAAFRLPVRAMWLVFLEPREIVRMDPLSR